MNPPERYVKAAMELKNRGLPLRAILEALLANGATHIELARVVKQVENTMIGTAHRLINETGVLPEPLGLVIAVPEDDPWHDLFFGSGEPKPDPT